MDPVTIAIFAPLGVVTGALITGLFGYFNQVKPAREGRRDAEKEAGRERSATGREQQKNRDLQRDLDAAKNALTAKAQLRQHESNTWDRIQNAWKLAKDATSEDTRQQGVGALVAMLEEPELTDVVAALLRAATDDVLGEAVEKLPPVEDDGDDELREGGEDDGQEDQDQR